MATRWQLLMRTKRPNGKSGTRCVYLAGLGLVLKDTVYQVSLTLLDREENVLPIKMELKLRNLCSPAILDLSCDSLLCCLLPSLTHTQDEALSCTAELPG